MKRRLLALISIGMLSLSLSAAELKDRLALGVYWPWERTQLHADIAGKELWQFVDDTMAMLHDELHCNVIWFVNGPKDPARVCDLAAKHDLQVLTGTKMAGYFIHGMPSPEQIRETAEATAAEVADKSALGAYVLKDEARYYERAQMDLYRQAMEAADPRHPSLTVTMTGHTEAYAKESSFPIICMDIYLFGADRSSLIPNPARSSQLSYRGAVEALNAMTRSNGKIVWVMPQAFTEIWGAYWLNDQKNAVLEPGTYWHWRMPTPAEIRWQTWEAIRDGCQGVVYFAIFVGGKETWKPGTGEMPEAMQKRLAANAESNLPLVQVQLDTGAPLCLTHNGGQPTPHAKAMATDFAALSKVEPLVVRWKAAEIPAVFAGEPAAVSSFKIAGDANRYAVVVNDDCQAESQLDLAFLPNTREVVDLLSGQTLALTPDSLGQEKLLRATLSLQPGAGTILRVAFSPAGPGHLLVDEDFALRLSTASFDHVECVEEPGGFGLGSRHAVRAQAGQSKDATITFDKLNLPPGRGGLLAGNLHKAARGEANVYLFIDGRCPQPESLVVQLVDDKGNAGWDKTVGYELPLLIPPTTQSIRIRPSDDAAIYRVRFWASPTAKTD